MAKNKETAKPAEQKQGFVKRMFFKYKEIIIYIIVGGITTLVRWGTTSFFENLLEPLGFIGGALSFFTTLISLVVTILFAFVPNKLYVFESKSFDKSIVGKEFVAFVSARAVASLIELIGIPAIAALLNCSTMVPTIIVSVVVLVVNYIFSKLVIFKKRVPAQNESLSERKAEKEKKSRNRKDNLIAIITTIFCSVIALGSIICFAFELPEILANLFDKLS